MASIVLQSRSEQGSSNLEWVKVVSAELQVCVHPAWSNNVLKGVQETLNSLLFRYNEDLDGVMLAYLDLKIPSRNGKILAGLSPYFRVNLTAKLLIFSPKVGMMLEGKVNKIEEDYIGVLVLGLFNAAIGVTDIRDGFHFLEEDIERSWVSDSQKHVIKLGTIIRFSVKSVEEKDEFLDLSGSLVPRDTGSLEWLTQPKVGELRHVEDFGLGVWSSVKTSFLGTKSMYTSGGQGLQSLLKIETRGKLLFARVLAKFKE